MVAEGLIGVIVGGMLVDGIEHLVPSSDGGDDLVWICGPGEGFGIKVGLGDKAVDGGLKIDNASKDTSL